MVFRVWALIKYHITAVAFRPAPKSGATLVDNFGSSCFVGVASNGSPRLRLMPEFSPTKCGVICGRWSTAVECQGEIKSLLKISSFLRWTSIYR